MDHIVLVDFRAALAMALCILLMVFVGYLLTFWAAEVLASASACPIVCRAILLLVSGPLVVIIFAVILEGMIFLGLSLGREV